MFVIPPRNETAELDELFQIAVGVTVTSPLKIFAPPAVVIASVAALALPTFVGPVIVTALPMFMVEVPPTVSVPSATVPTSVVTDVDPLVVILLKVVPDDPPIVCELPLNVMVLPAWTNVPPPPLFTQLPANW